MWSSAVPLAQVSSDVERYAAAAMGVILWLVLCLVLPLALKLVVPSRGLLNQIRFLAVPSAILFALVHRYWRGAEAGQDSTAFKIAQTAVAAAAVVLGMGLLNLVFSPAALKRWLRRDVPQLFLDVARYAVILVAVTVILKSVWGEDVTPLLGALGIGGIVLGLALQETLSNFFSGLALLAERPFSIGDWIRVGEGIEGQVEHVTWRAVKLRTNNNEYVIYPNSLVAKEKVVNFSLPTPMQARQLSIGTSYNDPPDLVKRVIGEVLADAPGVLPEPRPAVFTTAYADFSINYIVSFFIEDFARRRAIEDGVMSRLWYAFRRRGIEIPFPVRHLFVHGGAPAAPAEGEGAAHAAGSAALAALTPRAAAIERALRQVQLFAGLSPAELGTLARGALLADYGSGERVIRQGEPGDALYAITAGSARVTVRGADGAEREVAVLREGDVFGEMSLLTGEPRSATVQSQGDLRLVEVGKAALQPILAANHALAERMAEVMALRREGLDRARAEGLQESERREIAAVAGPLLRRIRAFFGLPA